jgi:PhoH-like ATPase
MTDSVDRQKSFVLDTNVLIHDPGAMFMFKDNDVVLPMTVIEELDSLKSGRKGPEVARCARQAISKLRKLGVQGSLNTGVATEFGGTIRVEINHKEALGPEIVNKLDMSIPDNRIVAVAYNLTKEQEKKPFDMQREVILVTKDGGPFVKASGLGILVEDYENDKVKYDNFNPGWQEIAVSDGEVDWLGKNGFIDLEKEFHPNEYVLLRSKSDRKHTEIGRYDQARGKIIRLNDAVASPYGLRSKNLLQRIAIDLLMNPDITIVSLLGEAGTGKTLLALAAALQSSIRNNDYDSILVSRPIMPVGKDIGYLPGTKDDKMKLWMMPIYDNLGFLFSSSFNRLSSEERKSLSVKELEENNTLELEALTYIRGRSFIRKYVIIDEAQNLTPHEVKTIITRAGEGTKTILTGDPEQIDNPYLDAGSNGLTVSTQKLIPTAVSGHVVLEKSERSHTAREALKYL